MTYYEPLRYIVTEAEAGWSLRAILRNRLQISRRLLIRLKQTDCGIMVNQKRAHVSRFVEVGDVVEIRMEVEQSETITPQPMPLDILYEDDVLLAINKPAGVVVHPTHGHYDMTIANAVVYYWEQQGKKHRFRAVHRLDEHTSGVLLIAKNPYVHQQISMQMDQFTVKKKYIAYVRGIPNPPAGTLNGPIGRDPSHPHRRKVVPDGASAVTHYRTVARYYRCSKVELHIETGRTHQIRVHMASIGCPVLGDQLYFETVPTSTVLEREMSHFIGRQALHAKSLQFLHPMQKQLLTITAPLPSDLIQLEQKLH